MPVIAYHQLNGEHIQDFALRVKHAIFDNTGTRVPDERLFRHVTAGMHPSIRAKLEYPAPLTLPQLFVWYEAIIKDLDPEDDFAKALQPPPPAEEHSIAEEQDLDLTVQQNDSGTCFKCGQPGHLAYYCDSKRKRPLQGKHKNKKRGKRSQGCNKCTTRLALGACKGGFMNNIKK